MADLAKRILAVDFGLARVGLAISDERQMVALTVGRVAGSKKTDVTVKTVMDALEKAQKDYRCQIDEIVVGLPLMMNGTIGFLADEVKHFAKLLEEASGRKVIFWDERLTSVQAERTLKEGGMSRKKRTQHVDNVAAVLILQNYLDHLAFKKNSVYNPD
ncbi:MAG: Holliday junction resolvase RuvX [Parachlamydiales bacterium]|jgi:putative Holliday junction resolvase